MKAYAGNHQGMPLTIGQSRLSYRKTIFMKPHVSVCVCAEAHRQLALVDEGQCGRYKAQVPPGEGANQRSGDCIQNLKEGKYNVKHASRT